MLGQTQSGTSGLSLLVSPSVLACERARRFLNRADTNKYKLLQMERTALFFSFFFTVVLTDFLTAGWLFSTLIIQSTCFYHPAVAPYSITPLRSVALPLYLPPSIYSISMLRRCKVITMAATVQKMEGKQFMFGTITELYLPFFSFFPTICSFCEQRFLEFHPLDVGNCSI